MLHISVLSFGFNFDTNPLFGSRVRGWGRAPGAGGPPSRGLHLREEGSVIDLVMEIDLRVKIEALPERKKVILNWMSGRIQLKKGRRIERGGRGVKRRGRRGEKRRSRERKGKER